LRSVKEFPFGGGGGFLPTKIIFGNGYRISYLYNATGQKVSKKVEADAITTTDYLNGFQYTNAKLNFFPHAEGYVNVTEFKSRLNYNYVFNYTDHLGNIRLSYATDPTTATLKVIEENHYYPFGLKHTNYNSDKLTYIKREENLKIGQLIIAPILIDDVRGEYNYKYNGKEYQDELGLNVYDFEARNYDPAIVRTLTQDPHAEKYYNWSPYSFIYNNPLLFIDPDGKDPCTIRHPFKINGSI
jgi:RHS repeat-associated protein